MRLDFYRWPASSLTWLGMALMIGLSSGCQQWSLRKSMNEFFASGDRDDWEPPVQSQIEEENKSNASSVGGSRSWWGRRANSNAQRVVLPRDRQKAPSSDAVKTTLSGAANTNSERSVLDATLPKPETTQSPRPSPQPVRVAIGGNPSGAPGMVVAAPTEPSSASTPPAGVVDTGLDGVDIESALQTLPPAFRETVRKTLTAVQEGKPAEGIEPATLAAHAADPSAPASLESPAAASPEQVAEKVLEKVSVRLNESNLISNPSASTTQAALPTSIPRTTEPPRPVASAPSSLPAADAAVAVRQESDASSVVATSAAIPAAAGSAGGNPSATWHSMISQAIERLESELESHPPSDESMRRSQEITLRMLYVSQRRLDDALRPIERLEAHEQEYVRHQMQALYEASNPDANPSRPRLWSSVMLSQREATSHLAAASNLEVRSVAFCTQVDGYGTYERFPKNQFAPDQEVLLYCEIDNVAAEKVKGGFETQLQASYEIRDVQGRLVADQELPMKPELCSNHRRDYYMIYRIYMPPQIPAGAYELRLTIHDKKGGKFGQSSAPFEIRN